MENSILLNLAIIIFFSKVLGAISRKFKQPPVIGMLLLGIILGPTFLRIIDHPGEIIKFLAQIGVLFLLFEAGLETDLKKIKEDSKQALLPAFGGILFPFILGFGLTYFFNKDFTQSLIVGIIFTATSVSVSVMTLLDLKKLKGIEGRCIVNAAIIDDIIGILLLTFIFGLTAKEGSSDTGFLISIFKIIIYFILTFVVGIFILKPLFLNLKKLYLENVVISIAIVIVLVYSWFAELSGLAAITGAYFAGLFLGQTSYKHSVQEGISNVGKSMFVDVFFVSIGLEFNLFKIDAHPLFLIGFAFLSIFGKLLGSGIGARLTNFDLVRSFRIGSGMIPRGEVALIVANMALDKKLIPSDILSATILMVIISALITPILLKFGFVKLQKRSF